MAGMNFQYDETGSTFYYFLVSFYALALIPFTFWVLRRKGDTGKWIFLWLQPYELVSIRTT